MSGTALGWGEDFECGEPGKRCWWLSSRKHGQSCHERKGTTVHFLHSKRLYWVVDQVWCDNNGKEGSGDWEKQHCRVAHITVVAGNNIYDSENSILWVNKRDKMEKIDMDMSVTYRKNDFWSYVFKIFDMYIFQKWVYISMDLIGLPF